MTPPEERILVVCSDEILRKVICSMLVSNGYESMAAESASQALELLRSGKEFALILSELTNSETLVALTNKRASEMPLVVITDVHSVSAALEAVRRGAYDYLLRPFEREQLFAAIRRALENRRLKRENDAYRVNLETLASARTEQLRNAMSDLERSYDLTLEALGETLNVRDAETVGHARRVTAFSIAIAKYTGLPKEQIATIARGAFLHDLGKIGICGDILRKPGKLTAEEFHCMKEHVWFGYKIVSRIPSLAEAAEIVHTHHEHYDGTGYPRGLKGDQIPIGARIVAIANTLDSVTSDLPYRKAQSFEAARKEIAEWSGRQFDPRIVQMFLRMPGKVWADLHKQITAHNQ